MRHYFSKRSVTWGAALLLVAVWQPVHAQAPRQADRQAGQYGPAAPYEPADGPMATPHNYSPQSAPQGPFDLSSIPQPTYVPLAATGNPAAAANPPSAAKPPSSGRKSPFSWPSFLKKSQQAAAPAPALSPQPTIGTRTTVPQAGAAHAQQPPGGVPIGVSQPPVIAAARLVGGQAPAALPRGPVVVYMPPGWQPPGATVNFTQREVSPEVPGDHWPMATRNPLGDPNAGGMFRWPKAARGEAEDTRPVPRVPAKAILPAGTVAEESRDVPVDDEGVSTWKSLLTTTSGPRPAHQKAKALFGLNPKPGTSRAPVARTAASVPPQAAAPAARALAPAPSPRASAAPLTRGPTPAVAASPPVVDSHNKPLALAEASPPEDDANKNLKWRAKGSPPRPIDADRSPADGASHAQVAAHAQPAEPTLAIPEAPLPVESGQAAPSPAVATPPAGNVPAPAATPANNQRALIPRSLLHPSPAVAVLEPAPGQGIELTTAPQSGSKALVQLAAPQLRKRGPTPAGGPVATPAVAPAPTAVAASSAPRQVQNKALFPTMFVKNSPREVSLTTKPRAPELPMMYEGPSERFDEYDEAASMDSYYAPTLESESAQRQQEGTKGDTVRSNRQYQDARSQAAPREIPPLAKPFVALSEITKLPRFITKLTREEPQPPSTPKFEESYPSDLARRGPSHKVKIKQRIAEEELDDEAQEDQDEDDVAPDVSAERPSKRRGKTDMAAGDETPQRIAPRERRELSANRKAKRDPREELHELYLSATADRATPNHDEPIPEGPDEEEVAADVEGDESASVEERPRQNPRRENVPVVAIEEEEREEPKSADSTATSDSMPARIRKSDGTSVLVYTKRARVSEPRESESMGWASRRG